MSFTRYEKFTNLKQGNPGLKTMIAVGGWNMGSSAFSRMVASKCKSTLFYNNKVTINVRVYVFKKSEQ